MKAQPIPIGARVCDSLPFSQAGTAQQAIDLRAAGADALAGYLGVINATRVGYLHAAGLAYVPVTLAGEYNDGPNDEIAQLKALGVPPQATVFLDLEGLSAFKANPAELIVKINTWANAITAAGYIPGLYVGVPQPLTSDELWGLRVSRYWRGQGSVRDRNNNLAEPAGCGWCMTQMYPSRHRGGVWVDDNMVGQDYRARVPTWVVAS